MDWAISFDGNRITEFWWGNILENGQVEDVDRENRKTLRWILDGLRMGGEWDWLRILFNFQVTTRESVTILIFQRSELTHFINKVQAVRQNKKLDLQNFSFHL
jgi:hypothetical protein